MTYQPITEPLEVTGDLTTTTEDVQLDAFSRLRVSQLSSLFNLVQLHDKKPLFVDEVLSGTATSVFSEPNSSIVMATAADGDYAIRQTKQRFTYFAGKSQLILSTFSGFESETVATKRIGYFSSSTSAPYTANLDGLFLQSDSTGISINIYRDGTQVEQTYQTAWNVDELDGTGPSGITVDWTKNQILVMDFQYLGIGRVRWYLDIDGELVKFHESNHANNLDTVYMSSPNQPVRWEIRQSGAGSADMRVICASVSSEGSIDTIGVPRGADLGTTHVNANSTGTEYAIIAVRLKSGQLDAPVEFSDFTLLSLTTDSFLWRVRLNPIVAGTFTYNDEADSAVQVAKGASGGTNTVTGGTLLRAGYQYQQALLSVTADNALRVGSNIDGTPDEYVLTATPLSSNADIIGTINWKEIT